VAADSLPRGIRSCYQAIYTITNEIADMVEEERGFNPLNHLRNAVCRRQAH
jgi:(3S)-linalool synthase